MTRSRNEFDAGARVQPTESEQDLMSRLRRVERERELYLGLLNLNNAEAPDQFISRALQLIVDIVQAQRGYLELVDPEAESGDQAWWTAAGCSEQEIAAIRDNVSRGIIAHSIAMGQIVSVPSALLDPRFRDRESVKRSRIEAVLCVPIGGDAPLGVVYLQGRATKGPFPEADIARAEAFTRHLLPLAEQFFRRHRKERQDPTHQLRKRLDVTGLIGRSEALARLLKEVELAAPVDVSLLLTGETGTGKSQLARVLHRNSPRHPGPFLELNCAAIPEQLLESELFGALAGAHSTAKTKMEGKVEAARGGTLFLDEIAELSLGAQAKLLQLIQTGEYYPLGASRPHRADIRVIAATNADLKERIRERKFREDLYYRLQVLPLRVPTLAERREDVHPLAEHFCAEAARRHGLSAVTLSPAAVATLKTHPFPGNVRELAHVVEAGTIRAAAEAAEQVQPAHLFPDNENLEGARTRGSFQEETRHFQRRLLQQALAESDWNIAQTARQLDLTRSHIYNLIKAFGLPREHL